MAELLTKRAGFWHFVRRVPKAFADLDRRGVVRQSTKIRIVDDPRGARATAIAKAMDASLEAYWRGLSSGRVGEAQAGYAAARARARRLGFDYVSAGELSSRPLDEIVARLEAVMGGRRGADNDADVAALLGGADRPAFLLSGLFDAFRRLQAASIADLSKDQVRKWANPKKRAIANLMTVVGDRQIDRISRSDAIDFRTWWSDRVVHEDLQVDTANKDFGALSAMLACLDETYLLGLEPVFKGLRIAGGGAGQRTAFLPEFVREQILAPGRLDGLNEDARLIVYLMAETGLRLSEAVNLTSKTIRLNDRVPHVIVAPEGRRMKTSHSAREIPLVGIALEAMKRRPTGFRRYRDKGGTLSAVVNKFFGENKLRPTDNHSLYSLRHTFEDRLTAVNAPDKVIAVLMGHKHQRPKYGLGPTLELKREWLAKIAFPVRALA